MPLKIWRILFKFQSDSINTDIRVYKYDYSSSLNSNLILLILLINAIESFIAFSLNSNLILLIPHRTEELTWAPEHFKFQSDSINTTVFEEEAVICENFKFQSDSINTE